MEDKNHHSYELCGGTLLCSVNQRNTDFEDINMESSVGKKDLKLQGTSPFSAQPEIIINISRYPSWSQVYPLPHIWRVGIISMFGLAPTLFASRLIYTVMYVCI